MNWSRVIPGTVVGVAALFLLLAMTAPATTAGKVSLEEFATLPVVADGRVKPIDTVARTALMSISKRGTFDDKAGDRQPALRWLLDAMVSDLQQREEGPAWSYKVFRVENLEVIALLALSHRPGSWRYSLTEIAPKWEALDREARRAKEIDPKQRNPFDQKVLELRHHIETFLGFAKWKEPLILPSGQGGEDWKSYSDALSDSFQLALMRTRADKEAQKLNDDELQARVRSEGLRILAAHYPAAEAWHRILRAYRDNDPKAFNEAVADFRKHQGQLPPSAESKARFEVFFNDFAPFYLCSVLYVLVFVLSCAAWIAYPEVLNRAAFWLALLTLALHSWALMARMYIQGRPPVTNLYSSAVFIGWGCVGLGLILERIHRNGIGNIVAAVLGGLTAMIAHHLAESSGDTLEMMQAVLDTNFWLATHVTCITLGYAATLIAGFLGILFILIGVFTPRLDREMFRSLAQMIYGVLCFATLLSFVGTVLGGIWADQSWGRFWGWDPKENGALLIVLMNALILHARWAGLVKQRGMAVLAIAGNMVIGWSWFGTNQLGVGLHAYGFNSTLATGLTIFWGTQLACIALGMLPTRLWKSHGNAPAEAGRGGKRQGRRDRPTVMPG